ncbi:MAG: aspartate/glutamate racemase family protein, partial [Hapalosiphonaceae cyanobacterium JJU2]
MKKILGILGGMGPMASTEFLKTIYECNLANLEQESPICILYSDPTICDRTSAIINNSSKLLIKSLIDKFEALEQIGVNKVVIPCITAHHFLPKLPLEMQNKVVSLIDIIVEEVLNTRKKYLLLCT